jgi:hypothetical protein
VDEELIEQSAHDGLGFEVEAFVDLRKQGQHWEVKVRWRGYTPEEDTWEPLQQVWEDVPVLLKNWLKTTNVEGAKEAAQFLHTVFS